MEDIGSSIRKIRKKQGLTIKQLADDVGVNAVYITRFERGDQLVSGLVFNRIADRLRLNIKLVRNFYNTKYPDIKNSGY